MLIAGSVLLLHAAALWALQVGLLRRAVELVVPVEILSSIVTPPAPAPVQPALPTAPAPLPPEKPRPVVQRPRPQPPAPAPAPAPRPVAVPSLAPAPQAPAGVTEPQPPAPPIAAPMTAAPAPVPALAAAQAPVPAAAVQLPSTNADYLQNPPPAYPAFSMRLREQGTVLLHVQISAQGTALDAQVKRSSGYPRLDRAALEAVRKWRYVPGQRGGVPETMWFDVPVIFELERTREETR